MASLHQPKQPQNLGQSASRSQDPLQAVTLRPCDHQHVDPLLHVFRIERPRASGPCPARSPSSHTMPKGKERKAQAVACMSLKQEPLSRRPGTNSSTTPCITFVAAIQSLSHARLFCNPKDCSSSVHEISQARILEWLAIPYSWESS